MKIGFQLNSVKDEIAKDGLEAILALVAKIGFDGVEFSTFFGYTPLELTALLKKYNLRACGMHFKVDEIINDIDRIREYALALDITKVIISDMPEKKAVFPYKRMIKQLSLARDITQNAKLRIGYHNHSVEFSDGEDYVIDFYNEIEGLNFELDFFWLKAAGKDCLQYLHKIKDRVFLTHIKEYSPEGKDAGNPVIGEGLIGAKEILELCVSQGYSWTVLEFEKPLLPYEEYMQKSFDFMKKTITDAEGRQ